MNENIIKLVQDLVRVNSTEGNSENAALILYDFLRNNGIETKIDRYKKGEANVKASIGSSKNPSIILSGHLDTVPTGNIEYWVHDPYSAKIIDNNLWGRGSVDMKGGLGCLASVMLELLNNEDDLNHQIIFAATGEEETGLQGARLFYSQKIMENASHLLIAEPTNLDIFIMEKGVLWLDIFAKGKQAHGSRPDLGRNAIEALASIIPQFYSVLPSDVELPEVGKSTLNVGLFSGGKAINVVPENAKISLDIRTTPGVYNNEVYSALNKIIKDLSTDEITYNCKIIMDDPAVITPDRNFANILAKNLESITGSKPKFGGAYYATDGAVYMKSNNTSFAIFGPGSTELLHQTNERLDLNQLKIAQKVMLGSILDISLSYSK